LKEIGMKFVLSTVFILLIQSTVVLGAIQDIPLYGLFETSIVNTTSYENPFTDVELRSVFTSPSGRQVNFFGFHDGDGYGSQDGNVWKQRFMPDEIGTWTYQITFSDGSPGRNGAFQCVQQNSKPGPLTPDPQNPHWFKTMAGDHFLPCAMHANCNYGPIDWQDAIQWCRSRGYNMLITSTFQNQNWGAERYNPSGPKWEQSISPDGNTTAFVTDSATNKTVDYDQMNIPMWSSWDDMIIAAGNAGIYIGTFDGPCGKYGGQESGQYPPIELAFFPEMRESYDSTTNKRILKYFVARQAAFWNIAYWSLGNTEVYDYAVENKTEFINYANYFASIAPFKRMITGQDCEQWHDENRRWLSDSGINFSNLRKLNTVQTGVASSIYNWGTSDKDNTLWQEARPNNELALDSYSGFPVMGTESLWEGQGRANKPLRIIWGFLAAGAHTMWADWRYDQGIASHRWGSIGRGWTPLIPISEHLFRTSQLGVDTVGDEQMKIAIDNMKNFEYWKMYPHNELVSGGSEAYCLAEPGRQYMVYAPEGGGVRLNLNNATGIFVARWLNPENGDCQNSFNINGGQTHTLGSPSSNDWVLMIKNSNPSSNLITNISTTTQNPYYVADGLDSGQTVYSDRSYVYSEMPGYLKGSTYIKTSNNDKLVQEAEFLSFDLNTSATIYIAHDERYDIKPQWLSAYMDTGDLINIDMNGNVVFRIFKKDYTAGKVYLGGNVNPAEKKDYSMYLIMAVPNNASIGSPVNLRIN
jgi:hypothetical protein